jgi:hypothetical protein
MKQSAKTFLTNANKIIENTFSEYKSTTSTKVSLSQNIQFIRDQKMQQWKQTVVETSNQVIATYVVAPILSHCANQLVGYLGNTIKKQYRSYKESEYRKDFESLKKNWEEKITNEKLSREEYEKELQDYHKSLLKLMKKTGDAKLFANILRENVPMDMTCVQACTNIISQFMCDLKTTDNNQDFTGICITIENADGSSYEYTSSQNPSHKVSLTLDANHFSITGNGNTETMNNNCLYESLISQIPELRTVFTNGVYFRECLSNYIENDEELQYTIAQGWHRFSIQKGSYGGATKKDAYSPKARYYEFKEITEQTFKKICQEHSHSSPKIQRKIQESLNRIHDIIENNQHNNNAAKQIDGVVEDFNQWLNKELRDNDKADLRQKLYHRMSSFREQANQTLHPDYENILQNIRTKENLANQSPANSTASHIADQTLYSKDDTYIEHLIGNSGKSYNDPDIIASVIHGKINKSLPEEDRRYNTVAVGIHDDTLYVAFNHVKKVDKQETFGLEKRECEEVFNCLKRSLLLGKCTKVVFVQPKSLPTSQDECRAPHAELQIIRYWKDNALLQTGNGNRNNKFYKIGASKPACLCCTATMKNCNVSHKTYAKTNIRPTNWRRLGDIRVQRIYEWDVPRQKR